MSTTRQSWFNTVLTYTYWGCFSGAAYALVGGNAVTGWGLLVTGLVLWSTVLLDTHLKAARTDALIRPTTKPEPEEQEDEQNEFCLSLTTPELDRNSGWESVTVRKQPCQYLREVCYGGPPVYNELWEYEIKERSFVFQRMIDDYIDDLWDPRFEVVNGHVQECLIEARHAEDKGGIAVTPAEEQIARLRQQVQWHEADGVVRYFILSLVMPYSGWRSEIEKLKEGIVKIAVKAEELGATLSEHGWYQLPEDASDEQKLKLDRLFSPRALRDHGFRSYRDWRERDHIIGLLEPPTETQS